MGETDTRTIRDLMERLAASGAEGAKSATYLRAQGVRIRLRGQSSGARWTLARSVELNPKFVLDAASPYYALSLLIHEACHLRQGALRALSVYGELEAWQLQFRFLRSHADSDAARVSRTQAIDELLGMPLSWDRGVLSRARQLMRAYGGSQYRVDILPLYPLYLEVAFWVVGRQPV